MTTVENNYEGIRNRKWAGKKIRRNYIFFKKKKENIYSLSSTLLSWKVALAQIPSFCFQIPLNNPFTLSVCIERKDFPTHLLHIHRSSLSSLPLPCASLSKSTLFGISTEFGGGTGELGQTLQCQLRDSKWRLRSGPPESAASVEDPGSDPHFATSSLIESSSPPCLPSSSSPRSVYSSPLTPPDATTP